MMTANCYTSMICMMISIDLSVMILDGCRVSNHPAFDGVAPTLFENPASPSEGEKPRFWRFPKLLKILDFRNLTFKNPDIEIIPHNKKGQFLVKFKLHKRSGKQLLSLVHTQFYQLQSLLIKAVVCFKQYSFNFTQLIGLSVRFFQNWNRESSYD